MEADIKKEFEYMHEKFDEIDAGFSRMYQAINLFSEHVDQKFIKLDRRLGMIEMTLPSLVTKDYLDDKLSELKKDS